MERSRRDDTAEALREVAAELDEQRQLLEDIKGILVTTVDGHNEHRAHVRDSLDRVGGRVLNVERRVEALEKVAR
jgi:hypothetical protein